MHLGGLVHGFVFLRVNGRRHDGQRRLQSQGRGLNTAGRYIRSKGFDRYLQVAHPAHAKGFWDERCVQHRGGLGGAPGPAPEALAAPLPHPVCLRLPPARAAVRPGDQGLHRAVRARGPAGPDGARAPGQPVLHDVHGRVLQHVHPLEEWLQQPRLHRAAPGHDARRGLWGVRVRAEAGGAAGPVQPVRPALPADQAAAAGERHVRGRALGRPEGRRQGLLLAGGRAGPEAEPAAQGPGSAGRRPVPAEQPAGHPQRPLRPAPPLLPHRRPGAREGGEAGAHGLTPRGGDGLTPRGGDGLTPRGGRSGPGLGQDGELDVHDGVLEDVVPLVDHVVGLLEEPAEGVHLVGVLLGDPDPDLVLDDVLDLEAEPHVEHEGGELLVDDDVGRLLALPPHLDAGVGLGTGDAADVPAVAPADRRGGARHHLHAQLVDLVLALGLQALHQRLHGLDVSGHLDDAGVHLDGPQVGVLLALGEVALVLVVVADHLEGLVAAEVLELLVAAAAAGGRLQLGVKPSLRGLLDDAPQF
eukprot:767463-Hanusia_phi.AAC.7